MTPTEVTTEMTALDVFCASEVMKWERIDCSPEDLLQGFFCICDDHIWIQTNDGLMVFSPTQFQHDAFEVLKRCASFKDMAHSVRIAYFKGQFEITGRSQDWKSALCAQAPTLELTICLFAHKLFSK